MAKPATTPFNQDEIRQIETMAGLGMSGQDIAHVMGISRSTLYKRLNDTGLSSDTIKAQRKKGIAKVRQTLYQMATSAKEIVIRPISSSDGMPSFEKPIGWDGKNFQETFKTKELPFLTTENYGWHSAITKFENRLIWGDNLAVMRSLPSETVDLIYIDPPFFSGRDYNCIFGDDNEVRTFSDIWEGGLPTYLAWLNARIWEMKRLLKPTGSIFIHLDWHAAHYVKVEMDKIFGYDNFINEIAWCYNVGGKSKRTFARKHDSILWYGKTDQYIFNNKDVRVPMKSGTESFGGRLEVDKDGRKYRLVYGTKNKDGKTKYYKYYLDEGKIPEDYWTDVNSLQSKSTERIGYPTQKPEELLKRIIKAASPKGGLVADFFSGGGTTVSVAEKLGRKWIGCDVSRIAVSVVRDRLATCYSKVVGVVPENSHPSVGFLIQNHGA